MIAPNYELIIVVNMIDVFETLDCLDEPLSPLHIEPSSIFLFFFSKNLGDVSEEQRGKVSSRR